MHVRVKFFDERRDARDTAGHPFEGQPHGGFRRAKCPHLVDIREGQAARRRTDLPGSDEDYGPAGSRRSGHPALATGSARSSEAHTKRQQRFILPARRYEARSLSLAARRSEPSQSGVRKAWAGELAAAIPPGSALLPCRRRRLPCSATPKQRTMARAVDRAGRGLLRMPTWLLTPSLRDGQNRTERNPDDYAPKATLASPTSRVGRFARQLCTRRTLRANERARMAATHGRPGTDGR